jgi:hypothetical protein
MSPFVKTSITGLAAVAVAAWAGLAQAQEIKRTEIKRSDLTGTNMEVIMTVLEAPPGAVLPKHFHYGEEAFYVLEGAMTEIPAVSARGGAQQVSRCARERGDVAVTARLRPTDRQAPALRCRPSGEGPPNRDDRSAFPMRLRPAPFAPGRRLLGRSSCFAETPVLLRRQAHRRQCRGSCA